MDKYVSKTGKIESSSWLRQIFHWQNIIFIVKYPHGSIIFDSSEMSKNITERSRIWKKVRHQGEKKLSLARERKVGHNKK